MNIKIILIFFVINSLMFSQTKTYLLKGFVKDQETLECLVGAIITIENTNNGAATRLNGEFELTLSGDTTILKISYIGYDSLLDTIIINNYPANFKEYKLKAQEITVMGLPSIVNPRESAINDIKYRGYYIHANIDDSVKSDYDNLASEYGFQFESGDSSFWKPYNDYVIKYLEKRNGKNWYKEFQKKIHLIKNK